LPPTGGAAPARPWAAIRLLSAVDCLDGPDETLAVQVNENRDDEGFLTVTVEAESSRWRSRTTRLRCEADTITIDTTVSGTGRPTSVHLLGGWRPPSGFLPSGSWLRTILSPNPDHPSRLARPAVEPATIGVTGEGSEPGVGHWLFTPAPWCFSVSREPAAGPTQLPDGDWMSMGIAAPIAAQTFTQLHYQPVTDGFSLRLDYEGHSQVDGEFVLPTVLLQFGPGDAYQAQSRYRAALRAGGLVPMAVKTTAPWWREPIFCGWGAQDQESTVDTKASELATQANYDRFLRTLEYHGVRPGTITVDDKWQQEYASCEPNQRRWPDLRGWIAGRHAAGQRVLLWWKAWDPEGAPARLCVRTPDGRPVALDPSHPDCRAFLSERVGRMHAADGLDADGLKIDFTARTPSGVNLSHHGPEWGAALLHRLLDTVYRAAKREKPDALIVTHTPNAAFADVTDMIRLNDARMLDAPDPTIDLVQHMTYRATVVAAACPELPIDTDGWSVESREQWRAYLAVQARLGVPSLYYADRVGDLAESLTAEDYQALRQSWADYRARTTGEPHRV
jgi:hypothetical protein